MNTLLLLIIGIPIIEIYLFIKIGSQIGAFNTISLIFLTAIIGVACSIVSDITNGKYNLLKWDKQEKKYYPIAINLYEKGEIDGNSN